MAQACGVPLGAFGRSTGNDVSGHYKHHYIFVKLHSNLQPQLNFSWLEKELTLFFHGGSKEEEDQPSPSL